MTPTPASPDGRPRVVILGGGPAGVGAAYRLAIRQAFRVTLIERNREVGGNAASFDLAGIPVDFGSHRLHPSCHPGVLADIRALLGEDLLRRPRHGRILLGGRWIRFPLRPLDLILKLPPKFVLGVGADTVRKLLGRPRDREAGTFESAMRRRVGVTISEEFYFPYARKIWGLEPKELSPVQARRRVSAGSPLALLKKVIGGILSQGGGKGRFFYYPRGGFGQIAAAYAREAEKAGATILRGASVTRVRRTPEGWRVEYESSGATGAFEAEYVWSTIPLTTLIRSLEPSPPAAVLDSADSIFFRAMILIYLVLEKARLTEFDAHYFPGPEIPVSRISEPKNYSGATEPANRTVVCGELPCSPQDRYWNMSDDELGRELSNSLDILGLPAGDGMTGALTRRLRYAYPIYANGYERHFDRLASWLGRLPDLITFGRQGLFAHDNTHHALFMAYAATECLRDDGRFDDARWRGHLEAFKSHVVED